METSERFSVEIVHDGRSAVVIDENRLVVADVRGDAREPHVIETAELLAAAPALRDALAALHDWIEQHDPLAPRALMEDAGQALQDAKGKTL